MITTTNDGGQTWETQLVQANDITGISCPVSDDCLAVGQNSGNQSVYRIVSTDGGTTWTVTSLASGSQIAGGHAPEINAISCFDTLNCVAAGVVFDSDEYETPITTTTDSGGAWSNQTVNPDGADLESVACVSSQACWAVGSTSSGLVIVHTISGGESSPTVSGISPNHGPTGGGSVVTITGSGFSRASSVSFGSAVTTNLTVESNTQLTVTLPPAVDIVQGTAATVDVTVTTGLGTSQLNPEDQFTYTG